MITHKKEFYKGLGLLIAFFVILIIIFTPVFKGENALNYLDALYNSISKGSAYYIPKVKKETDKFKGNSVSVTLLMTNKDEAKQAALLFTKSNAMVDDLKKQKKFKEAHVIELVKKKAVETSYNYYEIEPQKISDRLGLVIFSLVFYVVYTLWYGFAIMFLFEGWGLQLE
jgi:hypothetical protein